MIQLISAGLSFLSARRQRRQAKRQFAEQQKIRKEQQALLEQQKQEYRDIEFTNPYAGLENPYMDMENVMEDLTVDTRQADFIAKRQRQQRTNILQNLRSAAGGSGIAALAQTLANQGSIQAQQASASISQQEQRNRQLIARESARLQQVERAGELQTDMAIRGGDAMVQQAEMSRQATLLGMQYGEAAGGNMAYQQALRNQQAANASANQMMIGGMKSLMSTDFSAFGGGNGGGGELIRGGSGVDYGIFK